MKLKELKCGSKFTYKGHEFTKLATEKYSCYCLLNGTVFESEFGKTNDWAKSAIRKQLNKFDDAGNSFVLPEINKDDLVAVSLNYYAYGIPDGRTTDRITCLSWEEYIAYAFKSINKANWLRSGGDGNASYASCLTASGGGTYAAVSSVAAVRPALHFKKDLEVEI